MLMHPQSDSTHPDNSSLPVWGPPQPLAVMTTWSWGRAVILIVGGGGGCRVVGVVQMMHRGASVCLPPPPRASPVCVPVHPSESCQDVSTLMQRPFPWWRGCFQDSGVVHVFCHCSKCQWMCQWERCLRRNVLTPPPSLHLLPQVSLLEYRKRKQGGSRDSELAGSSSSTDGAHPRPGSHYRNDSHHTHSHQRRQPPASPNTCVSTSNRSPSIPQTEEVGLPEHHASSLKPKLQDSSSQWWVTMSSGTPGQTDQRVSPECSGSFSLLVIWLSIQCFFPKDGPDHSGAPEGGPEPGASAEELQNRADLQEERLLRKRSWYGTVWRVTSLPLKTMKRMQFAYMWMNFMLRRWVVWGACSTCGPLQEESSQVQPFRLLPAGKRMFSRLKKTKKMLGHLV